MVQGREKADVCFPALVWRWLYVVGLTTQLQSEELLEDPDVSGNLQRETGSWKPEVPLWTLACWFLEAVAWHK